MSWALMRGTPISANSSSLSVKSAFIRLSVRDEARQSWNRSISTSYRLTLPSDSSTRLLAKELETGPGTCPNPK